MFVLIIGGNISTLLLGWDGLGLRSYFLVMYYQNIKSNLSGFITVVSNRVGDVFIVFFVVLMLINGLTMFWFKEVSDFTTASHILALAALLAAITKSALFPYCT